MIIQNEMIILDKMNEVNEVNELNKVVMIMIMNKVCYINKDNNGNQIE